MKTVYQVALVDQENCSGCGICSRICPVLAIKMEKIDGKRLALVDEQRCQACTICATRCPNHAISMASRAFPICVGVKVDDVTKEVKDICRAAHMYPDQIVCYCHRIQAKEIVTAILEGAKTPEEVAQKTGARTGCGVLCITGVIRLLRAAGVELGKAPGYQWYGIKAFIWDIPQDIMLKYPQYYLVEDREAINRIFPGGERVDEGNSFAASKTTGF